MTQSQKAERFLALHHGPAPLVLPNAWDAASARVIEDLGFPAIATTSAGIANSLTIAPLALRTDGSTLQDFLRLFVVP